jgi:hypothetical protein
MSEPTEPFPPQPPVNYEQNKQPPLQPRKRGVPVWAWMLMALSSVTLVVAVIGIAVMVGGGSTTMTPAAQTSKNETACKIFEDGYNQLMDAVRLKLGRDALIEATDMLPFRMMDAEDKAEGEVYVALRDTREFYVARQGGSNDAGVAFFMSKNIVAEKCEADGVIIDLHEMK